MTPTEQAAYILELNRKTVQKYFRRIRTLIAEEGEKRLALQMDKIDLMGFYIGEIKARQDHDRPSATVPVFGFTQFVRRGLFGLPRRAQGLVQVGLEKRALCPGG